MAAFAPALSPRRFRPRELGLWAPPSRAEVDLAVILEVQPPGEGIDGPVSPIQSVAIPMTSRRTPLARFIPPIVRRSGPIRYVNARGSNSRLLRQSRRSQNEEMANNGITIPNTYAVPNPTATANEDATPEGQSRLPGPGHSRSWRSQGLQS
jgi:hypothetical protein